jgi:hypothetical protein
MGIHKVYMEYFRIQCIIDHYCLIFSHAHALAKFCIFSIF